MKEYTKRRFGISLRPLRHWTWWLFIVAVILLGVALLLDHPWFERMVWLALAVFTLIYAYSTSRLAEEAKEQRLDSSRPLLVPIGGKEGVARLVEPYRLMEDTKERWLHVHNIGLGPAVNVAIRLGPRSQSSSPRLDLDEMLTAVEPLAAGSKDLVRQWKTAEKPIEIYDDHWVVISYDDMFGRHFETEGRRIKESDSWVSIMTVQVKQPRPRVREVDYYARAFGRDEEHK